MLRKLVFALIALTAGLCLAEGGVRVWSVFFFPKMIRFDEELGWRRRPDTQKAFVNEWHEESLVVANRYGNRGVAHPPERKPNTYRVLVLGDSFGEGAQVNEADLFSAQLEASETGLEVINASVVAYGNVQEYLYLRDEGLSFQPDLVLVLVFHNDFSDNILPYNLRMGPRPYAVLEASGTRIVEEIDDDRFAPFRIPFPFSAFLYRHSYLFYALNDRVYFGMRDKELAKLDRANMDRVPWADRQRVLTDMLGRMKDLVAANGVELALFLIPSKEEVAAKASANQDEVTRWCAENNVDCIRGLEPMCRAAAEGRRPYFDVDIHWTKAGHDVAAAEIRKFLRMKRRQPQ
ncbi:MAG: hypothetical protein ACKVWV_03590 [Planctomycetota bacterium]